MYCQPPFADCFAVYKKSLQKTESQKNDFKRIFGVHKQPYDQSVRSYFPYIKKSTRGKRFLGLFACLKTIYL